MDQPIIPDHIPIALHQLPSPLTALKPEQTPPFSCLRPRDTTEDDDNLSGSDIESILYRRGEPLHITPRNPTLAIREPLTSVPLPASSGNPANVSNRWIVRLVRPNA